MMRDVTQEQEVQVRAHLQDRLAVMGQLAAGIAHDFNNMLTVILGFAEIMDMNPKIPESEKSKLRLIHSQGLRAEQLIRQVLDFSRQSKSVQQPIDLVPFVKEYAKLLERALPENIDLVVDITSESHVVNANLTQIQQVVTNLAVNAHDAMPDGGQLRIALSGLSITADQTEQPAGPHVNGGMSLSRGEWSSISVSDSGVGISKKTLTHIFEPFYTTKQRGKGTGLGLSQVQGIVEQHGGFIYAESEVGRESTFTVCLERVQDDAVSQDITKKDVPVGSGETILVVEGQDVVLLVVKETLLNLNYDVITATGFQEALKAIDAGAGEIDPVLSDVVMPGMGGEELVRVLGKHQPDVPIVLMTGYILKDEEAISHLPGVVGYLKKPLDVSQVAQVLNQSLNSSP